MKDLLPVLGTKKPMSNHSLPRLDKRVQNTPWGEPPARIGSIMDTSPLQAQFSPAVPGWRAQ